MSYSKDKTITFWERDNTNRLTRHEVPESTCETPKKEPLFKRWKKSFDSRRLYSSFNPYTPRAPIKGCQEVLGYDGWQQVSNNTCV